MTDALTLIDSIRRKDSMSEDDVLAIRRAFGGDLTFSPAEADHLFDLNSITDKPDSWAPYFTSVLAAYVDDREAPQDYVSDSSATWLIGKISEDGLVETETELKLLLNVLKTAHHVPDVLQKFALDQVSHAVISGTGHVSGKTLSPGTMGEAEVDLLRRVLYAGSSQGGVGITRTEAEAVFDLNDATSGRDNHASWQTLFVNVIANYLMVIAAPVVPTPAEAMRRENWLKEETGTRKRTSLDMIRSFKALFEQRADAKNDDGSGGYSNLKADAVTQAERIDLSEAQWLIDRLMADGVRDDNEAALLRFIQAECPDIDAVLQPDLKAA